MSTLLKVLSDSSYAPETKLHAMIAIGDLCLACEE